MKRKINHFCRHYIELNTSNLIIFLNFLKPSSNKIQFFASMINWSNPIFSSNPGAISMETIFGTDIFKKSFMTNGNILLEKEIRVKWEPESGKLGQREYRVKNLLIAFWPEIWHRLEAYFANLEYMCSWLWCGPWQVRLRMACACGLLGRCATGFRNHGAL